MSITTKFVLNADPYRYESRRLKGFGFYPYAFEIQSKDILAEMEFQVLFAIPKQLRRAGKRLKWNAIFTKMVHLQQRGGL